MISLIENKNEIEDQRVIKERFNKKMDKTKIYLSFWSRKGRANRIRREEKEKKNKKKKKKKKRREGGRKD